jgi:predicted AAA+ superfamily ATPase
MNDRFEYTLPEIVIDKINNLEKELRVYISTMSVSQTNENEKQYKKSSHFNSGSQNKKYKMLNGKKIEDEDWENIRKTIVFKPTKIVEKEGLEKILNDIRICLNKISAKNYGSQRDVIIENINNIMVNENENKENDMKLIVNSIFDIAINNKFLSELYAELYKELCNHFPQFVSIIDVFINQYKMGVKEIIYVDPTADYDKYCNYNKSNDKRKSLSLFMVNLMKKDLLTKEILLDLITYLQNLVFEYMDEVNKINEIEEITENLFIMITSSKTECCSEDKWNTIAENIKVCSQLKVKEKKSLSSRAVFKYMDIYDCLKK